MTVYLRARSIKKDLKPKEEVFYPNNWEFNNTRVLSQGLFHLLSILSTSNYYGEVVSVR